MNFRKSRKNKKQLKGGSLPINNENHEYFIEMMQKIEERVRMFEAQQTYSQDNSLENRVQEIKNKIILCEKEICTFLFNEPSNYYYLNCARKTENLEIIKYCVDMIEKITESNLFIIGSNSSNSNNINNVI